MLGVPSKRAIGFFGLSRVQLTTKPLKWVTKVSENFNLTLLLYLRAVSFRELLC